MSETDNLEFVCNYHPGATNYRWAAQFIKGPPKYDPEGMADVAALERMGVYGLYRRKEGGK